MLNKTVTVELRSIVTVFCLLGQSPVLHCGVFRDPKNFEKQINHLLCWWLKLLQLTVL